MGVSVAIAAAILAATTQATSAASPDPAGVQAEQQREQDERAKAAGGARTGGVIAEYKGRKINLAKDDLGAVAVCSEYPDKSVKCFDSEKESAADLAAYNGRHKAGTKDALPTAPKGRGALAPRAGGAVSPSAGGALSPSAGAASILVDGNGTPTCNWGWTCLWMDANYYGRKYQWSDDGSKKLGDWGIRDKASSTCNNDEMGGMALYDWRTGMPDPQIITALGGCLDNLHHHGYPTGGNWGDKADELVM
ncbi:peptidase inhibitor family I36 protein [Streptomyces sp. NPDC058623]|uniref:peptidase inhibitor family I36 protein n=1 Tax=Streptomyces sp. NPDC058623 TaxID=3346563 RepID=UPI003650803A